MNIIRIFLALMFLIFSCDVAFGLDVPHTFSPGTTIKSGDVNENFSVIYDAHTNYLNSLSEVIAKDYNNGELTATTINLALNDIGSNLKRLVISDNYVVSSNITFPSNVIVEFKPGGKLTISNGAVVTFNSQPIAQPNQQIFAGNGMDEMVWTKGKIEKIYVNWFGAIPDDATTDFTAFVGWNNACDGSLANCYVLPGKYNEAFIQNYKGFKAYGIGNPILTNSTVTPLALGGTPLNGEAAFNPGVTGSLLTSDASKGATTINVASASGYSVDDWIYIASKPSSFSSVNNWIPLHYEFVRIKNISTNTLTLYSPLKYEHTTANKAITWKSNYLAINALVDGFTFETTGGSVAYMQFVQHALNSTISNCIFRGNAAFGAIVFSDNIKLENITMDGVYNGISTARGTGNVVFDHGSTRLRSDGQQIVGFFEESLEKVIIKDWRFEGGKLYFTNIDTDSTENDYQRGVIFDNVKVDSPVEAIKVSSYYNTITFNNSDIEAYSVNDSGMGISTPTLIQFAFTNTLAVKFFNTNIWSKDAGSIYQMGTASGFPLFEDDCRFYNKTLYPYSFNRQYYQEYEGAYWYRRLIQSNNIKTLEYRAKNAINAATYDLFTVDASNGSFIFEITARCNDSGVYKSYKSIVTCNYNSECEENLLSNAGSGLNFTFTKDSTTKVNVDLNVGNVSDLSIEIKIPENSRALTSTYVFQNE